MELRSIAFTASDIYPATHVEVAVRFRRPPDEALSGCDVEIGFALEHGDLPFTQLRAVALQRARQLAAEAGSGVV